MNADPRDAAVTGKQCPVCCVWKCAHCAATRRTVDRILLITHGSGIQCHHCASTEGALTPVNHHNSAFLREHQEEWEDFVREDATALEPYRGTSVEAVEDLLIEIGSARADYYAVVRQLRDMNRSTGAYNLRLNYARKKVFQVEQSVRQWVRDHPEDGDST